MLHELNPNELHHAISLFADLTRVQLSAGAVLEGESMGRVVVDDVEHPGSGLVTSPEGAYLAGRPDNAAFNLALREYMWSELFGKAGWFMVFATLDGAEWEPTLEYLLSPRQMLRIARRHYTCRRPSLDWRAAIPDGYEFRVVDQKLLSDESVAVPDHIRGWIQNNWSSLERYTERGFGCATVHDSAVVSWSLADCRCGAACEIGIQTLPDHRRRGLGAVTAAATVEHALKSGFDTVGWHCHEDNLGSIGTAEKAGFELERKYESLYGYAAEEEELAELGWVAFRAEQYDKTIELYERVFELQPDAPDYKYHLVAMAFAATGNEDRALEYLNRAIDRGWRAAEFTSSQPEFEPLHDSPGWRKALDRMAAASAED